MGGGLANILQYITWGGVSERPKKVLRNICTAPYRHGQFPAPVMDALASLVIIFSGFRQMLVFFSFEI